MCPNMPPGMTCAARSLNSLSRSIGATARFYLEELYNDRGILE